MSERAAAAAVRDALVFRSVSERAATAAVRDAFVTRSVPVEVDGAFGGTPVAREGGPCASCQEYWEDSVVGVRMAYHNPNWEHLPVESSHHLDSSFS